MPGKRSFGDVYLIDADVKREAAVLKSAAAVRKKRKESGIGSRSREPEDCRTVRLSSVRARRGFSAD